MWRIVNIFFRNQTAASLPCFCNFFRLWKWLSPLHCQTDQFAQPVVSTNCIALNILHQNSSANVLNSSSVKISFKRFYIICFNSKIFFMKFAWNISNNCCQFFTHDGKVFSRSYLFSQCSFYIIAFAKIFSSVSYSAKVLLQFFRPHRECREYYQPHLPLIPKYQSPGLHLLYSISHTLLSLP